MVVHIPTGYTAEKHYILEILLFEFLGLSYQIKEGVDLNCYKIEIDNQTLVIEDHFFNNLKSEGDYLAVNHIPDRVKWYSSQEFAADNLPVIYGIPNVEKTAEGIRCQIDLLASAFFMLTRWEEHVIKKRDPHNRFPSQHSLAYKNNFLARPVVNEYIVMLREMLSQLSSSLKFKNWSFECIPTHDVDHLLKWRNLTTIRKKLAHDFITEKRYPVGIKNIYDLLKTKMGLQADPYDTFKYIVNLSKSNGLTSRFYFMSGGISRYDNNYAVDEVVALIGYLKENDQIIGFHPSYDSIANPDLWHQEKQSLEQIAGVPIQEGRQHYLKFSVPDTWRLWNDEEMIMDSTLGYSDNPGFRCGTCYPYTVFDFVNRKKLSLKENPLILMEATLISYMRLSPTAAFEVAKRLYFTVKKYNGNFTFLWHNSSMHTVEHMPYLHIYENIIKGFPDHAE